VENLNKADKRKLINDVISRAEKQYGRGALMCLGDSKGDSDIETISTGSLMVDDITGIGGLPKGRVVEIFGPEASGKTTIALQAIAECQAKGGLAAFIDAEHALDISYAISLGIKLEELFLSQPDYGEQALEIVEMLVRSCGVDIIVVDSVAALVPKSEIEGEMGESHMGLQARLMSQALRKLTSIISKSKICLVFINQIRQNISSMPFAQKETTTGGTALKFYSSLRLDVRRIGSLNDKDGKSFGNKVLIKVAKNKLSLPFRTAQTHLVFGKGICKYYEIVDMCIANGALEQNGSWYSFNGNRVSQGKENLIKVLKEDPSLFKNFLIKATEKGKTTSLTAATLVTESKLVEENHGEK
jgi:recombination protein RecA